MKNTNFLNNIKNFFKVTKKEDRKFQKQVQSEKKQKYLFKDENTDNTTFKRRGNAKIRGKKQKNTKAKITTFIQDQINIKKPSKDLGIFMSAISGLLFILCAYIIWFSPYFKISANNVLIEGLNKSIDINIAYKSIEDIYGKNIFSINQKKITKNLKESMSNIENIEVDRLFPNGVKILIKTLPNPFDTTIFWVANHRWGLSANGVLVPISDVKNNEFQYHLQIVSKKLQTSLFRDYKKIISDKNAFLLQRVFKIFSSEWSDLKIASAKYFLVENEVHIILESNTKILFTLQDVTGNGEDIKERISREFLGLKEYIQQERNAFLEGNITYVDARIPGKLFVCFNANVCTQNLIKIYGNAYQNTPIPVEKPNN